jgi:hypothetical protein
MGRSPSKKQREKQVIARKMARIKRIAKAKKVKRGY